MDGYGIILLPSELNAAYLYGQLEVAEAINKDRLISWHMYYEALKPLDECGLIVLPVIPLECQHNAHMFYIKVKNLQERSRLIGFLSEHDVYTAIHYIPLHTAPAGRQFGRFSGEDVYTTKESERLLRLPMYYGLKEENVDYITRNVTDFLNKTER